MINATSYRLEQKSAGICWHIIELAVQQQESMRPLIEQQKTYAEHFGGKRVAFPQKNSKISSQFAKNGTKVLNYHHGHTHESRGHATSPSEMTLGTSRHTSFKWVNVARDLKFLPFIENLV
jgi:hypothetical protein